MFKSSHRPNRKSADVLASTLACTTADNALVNCSWYVPQRPDILHRPHVILTICALYCRAAVSMSIPALSQSSTPKCIPIKLLMCVLMLKISNRPDGKTADALAQLTLAQLRTLRSTTESTCRRDLEKFPSPQWEFHMFCACACRAAVFLSAVAR